MKGGGGDCGVYHFNTGMAWSNTLLKHQLTHFNVHLFIWILIKKHSLSLSCQLQEAIFITAVDKWPPWVFHVLPLSRKKQMAIGASCSQQWIKLYNTLTPTACHNGWENISEYQTPQPQFKYLTTYLPWVLSYERWNVSSLFDRKAPWVSGGRAKYPLLYSNIQGFRHTKDPFLIL